MHEGTPEVRRRPGGVRIDVQIFLIDADETFQVPEPVVTLAEIVYCGLCVFPKAEVKAPLETGGCRFPATFVVVKA